MLQKTRQEYEEMLMQAQQRAGGSTRTARNGGTAGKSRGSVQNIVYRFYGTMAYIIKPDIKLPTYSGYCMDVKSAIASYFHEKGIYLQDLTASDINDFYAEQLKHVKATLVHKYHANNQQGAQICGRKRLYTSYCYG